MNELEFSQRWEEEQPMYKAWGILSSQIFAKNSQKIQNETLIAFSSNLQHQE